MKAMTLSIVAIGVAVTGVCAALYEGFCIRTAKFPDEKAVVSQAVEYVIATYPPAVVMHERKMDDGNSSSTRGIPDHPVRYENVEEFLRKNPGCCELVERAGEGYKPSFLSRLLGKESRIVRLRFDVVYLESGGEKRKSVEKFVAVKRCGGVFTD